MEAHIAQAAEDLNGIRKNPCPLLDENVRLVCKAWSGVMLKMELDTHTSSCSQGEKEVLGACALKVADIFLTLADSKRDESYWQRLSLHCVDLVRMLVVCHTIYVEANTIGAVVKTLCEIDEMTTEGLWLETIKVQLWTARRELDDAKYCIGGLKSKSAMKAVISTIENGLSVLQQDANALNYMMMKIGEGIVPLTPTIVGDTNVIYTRAITELENMKLEVCRPGISTIDQREILRDWVEEKISTLIFLPPHSVPFPKAGEFYTFNY